MAIIPSTTSICVSRYNLYEFVSCINHPYQCCIKGQSILHTETIPHGIWSVSGYRPSVKWAFYWHSCPSSNMLSRIFIMQIRNSNIHNKYKIIRSKFKNQNLFINVFKSSCNQYDTVYLIKRHIKMMFIFLQNCVHLIWCLFHERLDIWNINNTADSDTILGFPLTLQQMNKHVMFGIYSTFIMCFSVMRNMIQNYFQKDGI